MRQNVCERHEEKEGQSERGKGSSLTEEKKE